MINIGLNSISNIKIGGTQVNKVYAGAILVWEYIQDYSRQYLTFKPLQDSTFRFSKAIDYSVDDGQTWTTLAANTESPTINTGDKIMWKGELTSTTTDGIGTFSSTGTFNAMGNIMSLVYGDNFANQTTISNYQFYKLFKSSKIVDASNLILPATTLTISCYREMFDSSKLQITPMSLPATTLADSCCRSMFGNCTSLTTAMNILPAMTLAQDCYRFMFGNSSLTTGPELPASTLATQCYYEMFRSCTSLTSAPALPATTLAPSCYYRMFRGCTNLAVAPELPATTLSTSCYYWMFDGCSSLTTAPELPATILTENCYNNMFRSCTSLNYIKCLATDITATGCTTNWVYQVASTGTFVKNKDATWNVVGDSGVPTGWVIEYDIDYSTEYLTFEALDNSMSFSFTNDIDYSIDDGQTWTTLTANTESPTLYTGDKIMWKGEELTATTTDGIGTFSSTGTFNAMGNIMSLIYGVNFKGENKINMNYCFRKLFYNSFIVDAHNLILPATTLTKGCYQQMFAECSMLTTAPTILPAYNLSTYCYAYMFNLCSALTTAPELPAMILVSGCYASLFQGCMSLNYIKMMATYVSPPLCLFNWVNGVSSTGTFVKNKDAIWEITGSDGVPTGWTVITE